MLILKQSADTGTITDLSQICETLYLPQHYEEITVLKVEHEIEACPLMGHLHEEGAHPTVILGVQAPTHGGHVISQNKLHY